MGTEFCIAVVEKESFQLRASSHTHSFAIFMNDQEGYVCDSS